MRETFGSSGLLVQNGYRPIPISLPSPHDPSSGKRPHPAYPNWVEWDQQKHSDYLQPLHHCGTGLLAATTPACDIDVLHEPTAAALEALARDVLGDTTLCRVGLPPKRLLVYRADTTLTKVKSPVYRFPADPPIGKDFRGHAVEILAAGQQFVAFGTHPGTRRPYQWRGTATPYTTPLEQLPTIDQDRAARLIHAASDLMDKVGMVRAAYGGGAPKKLREDGTSYEAVLDAVRAIPNADVHYDDWVRIGFAIKGALGPPGLPIFDEWSARSAKYDARKTAKAYHSFAPTQIGTGTLFYGARRQTASGQQQHPDQTPPPSPSEALGSTRLPAPHPAPLLPRTVVQLRAGDEAWVVDDAEAALLAHKAPVYQRNTQLVTPYIARALAHKSSSKPDAPTPVTTVSRLKQLSSTAIQDLMCRYISFERFVAKKDGGEWKPTPCPQFVGAYYVTRCDTWQVPHLTGIINAPTIRADGTILDHPGYDEQTGILYQSHGVTFPKVKEYPTLDDVRAAIGQLDRLLKTPPNDGFPFVTPADRSVALSGVLTALIRRTLSYAPAHAYTAAAPGTGKSKLVDLISILATGDRAPVSTQSPNEEETEKRLTGSLLSGDVIITLDNCEHPVGGALLCQMASQSVVRVRPLGTSDVVPCLSNAMLCITGNQLRITGDLPRRTLMCTLVADTAAPEEREFERDCVDLALAERPTFVHACLTILRAYHVQSNRPKLSPYGNFDEWSARVRAALVWAGEADPCNTRESVRASDPKLVAITTAVTEWYVAFKDQKILTREVVDAVEKMTTDRATAAGGFVYEHPNLRDALVKATTQRGTRVTSAGLSTWLSSIEARKFACQIGIFAFRRIRLKGEGAARWYLDGEGAKTAPAPVVAPPVPPKRPPPKPRAF